MPSGGHMPHLTTNAGLFSSTRTSLEQAMANRLVEMEAMIQQIPGVPTPLKKSLPQFKSAA